MPIQADLQTVRVPSYTFLPKKLTKDKDEFRLLFKGMQGHLQMAVSCRPLGDWVTFFRLLFGLDQMLKIDVSGQQFEVAVNVDQLAFRLGIKKQQIKESAKNGGLEELIKDSIPNALKHDHCPYSETASAVSSSLNIAVEKVNKTYQAVHELIGDFEKTRYIERTSETLPFLAVPNPEDSHPTLILIGERLGEGSFGTVSKGYDTSNGECAVKIGKNKKHTKESLENEYQMLRQIHRRGTLKGIQLPPYRVVKFEDGDKVGVIEPAYDGNLRYVDKSDQGLNRERTRQLTQGLANLHRLNICHGDIKIENVLVSSDRCDIADFGDARSFDQIKKLYKKLCPLDKEDPDYNDKTNEIFGVFTRQLLCVNDIGAFLDSLSEKGDWATCEQILRKRDVYALGLTLIEANSDPLCLYSYLHSVMTLGKLSPEAKREFKAKGYTKHQIEMIERMINKDYKKRPTAKEVAQAFS